MQPQLIAGRYQVLRAIGRGGMGTVWLCRDEVLGREVAVKQIGALPGESATETKRAMREARSAAALNHPNAVAVYDVVDHDGLPWLVMEYVEGQTLADEISHDGRLSPQRVADIGAQLAGALARAHERGVVHRDIKPGNVLIDKAGRPKISDFGIARGHGDEQLTQIGFITGTPGYLSPELARGGDPLPASDVWALGATLYTAVEGRPPYEPRSNPIALLRTIAAERPRSMIHAGALGPAIDAMMLEDPARRWDMATSAKRLGRIARTITAVIPRPDPVGGVPLLESTQALQPTQALAGPPPVAGKSVAAVALAASRTPVVVAQVPVAPVPVAQVPVARVPVAQVPVGAASPAPMAVARVVTAPVVGTAMAPKPHDPPEVVGDPPVVPSRDQRRGQRWLPLVLVALLAVGLGVVFLSQLGGQGGANPGAISAPTVATSTAPTPTTTTPPTPSANVSTTPPATTSAPPTVTVAPTANAQGLDGFLKSYYSEVTSNTSLTWGQLSPRMQQAAGGRAGYDGWWKTIASVVVSQTRPNAAGTSATANLTFTRKNGTISSELDQFTFVPQGAGYLIDSGTPIG
jgi:eukaryotic-like serine/threonine-protein kinase